MIVQVQQECALLGEWNRRENLELYETPEDLVISSVANNLESHETECLK